MLRECDKCKRKISFLDYYKQYIIRDRFKYICSNCGAVHKVSNRSKIVSIVTFMLLFILVFVSSIPTAGKISILIIYIIFLEPLLARYEVKD